MSRPSSSRRSLLGCARPGAERAALSTDLPTLAGFGELTQVAVITPDAERTVLDLAAALGAGGFKVVDMTPPALLETTLDGAPAEWSMRLGITWIGATQLEVIQPLSGRTVMTEFLDERGGPAGVQHVFLDRGKVPYADALERFAAAGMPLVQQAKLNAAGKLGVLPMPAMPDFMASKHASRFGYTRSRAELGLDIELARFPPGVSQRLALRAAIPDRWLPEDASAHFETVPDDALLSDIDGVYVLTDDLPTMVDSYAKLMDSKPTIEPSDDLPGVSQRAQMRFGTTLLSLVRPESGPLARRLAEYGPGVQLVRGRPAGTDPWAALAARGWAVVGEGPDGALLAEHGAVPFALWLAPR